MIFEYTDAFVTLATVEVEILIQFYTKLLGQKPQPYIPNLYGEFHLSGLRLGIFKPRKTDEKEFINSSQSGISLCLEVRDLESAIAHFDALGYPPPGEIISASHGREIYAYDPGGNRLILHQSINI